MPTFIIQQLDSILEGRSIADIDGAGFVEILVFVSVLPDAFAQEAVGLVRGILVVSVRPHEPVGVLRGLLGARSEVDLVTTRVHNRPGFVRKSRQRFTAGSDRLDGTDVKDSRQALRWQLDVQTRPIDLIEVQERIRANTE